MCIQAAAHPAWYRPDSAKPPFPGFVCADTSYIGTFTSCAFFLKRVQPSKKVLKFFKNIKRKPSFPKGQEAGFASCRYRYGNFQGMVPAVELVRKAQLRAGNAGKVAQGQAGLLHAGFAKFILEGKCIGGKGFSQPEPGVQQHKFLVAALE